MRTFDENLRDYHCLIAQGDIYELGMQRKLTHATTKEEMAALLVESFAHFTKQGELFKELGEEMAKIMNKKWWQFWKG